MGARERLIDIFELGRYIGRRDALALHRERGTLKHGVHAEAPLGEVAGDGPPSVGPQDNPDGPDEAGRDGLGG